MLDDFLVPHISHDKENPIIKEGDIFADECFCPYYQTVCHQK